MKNAVHHFSSLSTSTPIEVPGLEIKAPIEKVRTPRRYFNSIIVLKESALDDPFLSREVRNYTGQLAHFKRILAREYAPFQGTLNKLFLRFPENRIIKRRTPVHEKSIPFLITEDIGNGLQTHLLI